MKRWLCGLLLLVLLGTGCAAQPYAARPAPELPARRYTTSDDPDEIAAASEDILVVTTLDALPPGELNGTQSYRCRVEAVRRGGTAVGETVIVVFFADTVAAGETVLVLANRSHPDSLVYTLSSARSVLPAENVDYNKAV